MIFKNDKKEYCFCAFCRNPHPYYEKKGIAATQVFLSLIFSLTFMYGMWESWNLSAIPLFIAGLFVGEVVTHLRWRLALVCRQCGFDPVIYKKSPARAAAKVKAYLAKRKSDPEFLLAPPIQVPKRTRESDLIGY